ncbi:methylmalonate-semialdehyde dehydrogenase (CoA acylating), partial [Thermus scotoductus]
EEEGVGPGGVEVPEEGVPTAGEGVEGFGLGHPHGPDAFLFYTQRKVVVERW